MTNLKRHMQHKRLQRLRTKIVNDADVCVCCNADEADCTSQRKRSTERLADRLQGPLMRVIEDGDVNDFDEHEVNPPVAVHEPDPPETILPPPLDHIPCHGITTDHVQTHSGRGNSEEMKELVNNVSSHGQESISAHHHADVLTALPPSQSRVPTPPTFDETSATLQAIEEAGRFSPVDVMELVDRWKGEKTHQLTLTAHTSDTDDELPSFGMVPKPRRNVINGVLVNSDPRNLEDRHLQSNVQCTQSSKLSSSSKMQVPLEEMAKASIHMDRSKGSAGSRIEKSPEEMVNSSSRMNRSKESSGHKELEVPLRVVAADNSNYDKDSDLSLVATGCNNMSIKTHSEKHKYRNGDVSCPIPQTENRKLRCDGSKEEGEENFGFSRPAKVSSREPQSASKQHGSVNILLDMKVSWHQNVHPVDQFSSLDDTNDDEVLAMAAATPVVSRCHVDRHCSADVSGTKAAEHSQLTFTQALACIHDSIDVAKPATESSQIHARSKDADPAVVKSVKLDRPQFDLGFELSDDDEDGDDDADDDSDDVIPPSPPMSNSWKSGTVLGSRPNGLITVSRQNSCGSFPASGPQTACQEDATDVGHLSGRKSDFVENDLKTRSPLVPSLTHSEDLSSKILNSSFTASRLQTGKPEDVMDVDCSSVPESEFVREDLDVANVLPSNLLHSVERSSSETRKKSSISIIQNVVKSSTVAVDQTSEDLGQSCKQKSTNCTSMSQSDTAVMDQKSRYRQPAAVEMEQKSHWQAVAHGNTVADDQKSTCSNQVAVIRPCMRSSATPTVPADQSEMSPSAILSSSTPLKLCADEKSGEFEFDPVIEIWLNDDALLLKLVLYYLGQGGYVFFCVCLFVCLQDFLCSTVFHF